jgi:pimeloyl-ACP methyl ester carboxylesterase
VKRWVKVLLAVLVVLIALLVLNAITVGNETKDAEVNVEGAELVETSGGTLQVLDEGNPAGSPIVLIHGYTASMNWFEELGPLLGQNHRVIRVDMLGHGGSDKPAAGYEIQDQAKAIAEALAQLDVTNATVVGHSLGGTVATAVAEQSPELATRVVILDKAANDEDERDLGFVAQLGYTPVIGPAIQRTMQIAPDSVVRGQYEQGFAPGFNMASGFENPDQVVEDLREMTYTAFVDIVDADSDYTDTRSLDDRLSGIEVPLLVVFGTEDQIYDAESSIEPYTDVPGVQTELLEGVGHSPNVEAPEKTAALIEAFIARTEAAERAERRAEARREARKRAARRAARAKAQAARKQAQAQKEKNKLGTQGEPQAQGQAGGQ